MLSAWVALAEKCRQRLNLKLEFIVFLSSLLSECWGRAGGRIWGLFGLVGLGLVLGPVVRLVFGFLLGGFFGVFFETMKKNSSPGSKNVHVAFRLQSCVLPFRVFSL